MIDTVLAVQECLGYSAIKAAEIDIMVTFYHDETK